MKDGVLEGVGWFRRNRCWTIGFLGMVCCVWERERKGIKKCRYLYLLGPCIGCGAGRDMHAIVSKVIPSRGRLCLLQHPTPPKCKIENCGEIDPRSIDAALGFWLISHQGEDRGEHTKSANRS